MVGDPFTRAVLLTVAVLGAVVGAKVLCWLEDRGDRLHRTDPLFLLQGKSIVGALLGGLLAVEATKPWLGVRVATGDLYVRPLWTSGLAIGRVGCFLSGVTDGTHGVPSTLPWAMDLGDGVPRHPDRAVRDWVPAAPRRLGPLAA